MTARFLRRRAVEQLIGLSASTIYRLERQGRFPRRRRLGPNSVAWRLDEVERWITSREEVSSSPRLVEDAAADK